METNDIKIYCNNSESEHLAKAVGYGIEEEGLPYQITFGEYTRMDAYEVSHRAGLGVSILVLEGKVSVFTRQLQERKPLFDYPVRELESAKVIGKNAARIVKNKPFIDLDEMGD